MPTKNSSFQELSEKIASRFLQTVVVVDDQPVYAEKSAVSNLAFPDTIQEPRARKKTTPNKTDSKAGELETGKRTIPSDSEHELDIQSLIEVFSDKGLICSVLRPSQSELNSVSNRVVKLARNADLLILDWVLFDSIGDTTITIINEIIKHDQGTDGRLRTIIIYTGEVDIFKIAERINVNIIGNLLLDNGECSIEKPGLVRISVFAKDHVKLPAHLSNRKISIQNLPDIVISEFSKFTSGLVPNVALESLAALRENTHILLARLHSNIDIPFLTHRALLPEPDDSAEHLVDLITGEIRCILDECDVKKNAYFDIVKKWIEAKYPQTYSFDSQSIKLTQTQILNLLQIGIDDFNKQRVSNSLPKLKDHKLLSKMFCSDTQDSNVLDYDFSIITSLARQQANLRFKEDTVIKLTLGTILQICSSDDSQKELTKYWLCVQPRCDSILKAEDKRFFPFLPLEIVTIGKFNLVIKDTYGNYILLKLIDRVYEVKMECFSCSSVNRNSVIAKLEDIDGNANSKKAFIFKTTEGSMYRWIAELKRDHAQRIVNSFASNLSRVGLNESEWLRRSAQ